MKKKTTQNMMRAVGATLAVCSAAAIIGSAKNTSNKSAKKTIMKTADKVVGFVDTMASFM